MGHMGMVETVKNIVKNTDGIIYLSFSYLKECW